MRIGIFDSGSGGLSVYREIENVLPDAKLLYLADKANFPYGNKTQEEIVRCTLECAKQLATQQIDLLVIACHTASAYALPTLQQHLSIPVLGMIEPTCALVNATAPHQRLLLFATEATLQSGIYQNRLQENLLPLSGGPLATLIEDNAFDQIPPLLKTCLAPAREGDTLLLACTHYPAVESLFPGHLRILNPAKKLAQTAKSLLTIQHQNF
jgi:glutamate racemase